MSKVPELYLKKIEEIAGHRTTAGELIKAIDRALIDMANKLIGPVLATSETEYISQTSKTFEFISDAIRALGECCQNRDDELMYEAHKDKMNEVLQDVIKIREGLDSKDLGQSLGFMSIYDYATKTEELYKTWQKDWELILSPNH